MKTENPFEETGTESTVKVRVQTLEPPQPTLLDVSAFLYDFNLLYEVGRLSTDEKYRGARLSHATFYRWGRPIYFEDRLRVESLRHESPIEVSVVLQAVTGAFFSLAGIAGAFLYLRKQYAEGTKLQNEGEYYKALTQKTEIEVSKAHKSYSRMEAQLRAFKKAAKSMDEPNNNLKVEGFRIDQHALDDFTELVEQREALAKFINILCRLERASIKMSMLEIKLSSRKSDSKR